VEPAVGLALPDDLLAHGVVGRLHEGPEPVDVLRQEGAEEGVFLQGGDVDHGLSRPSAKRFIRQ